MINISFFQKCQNLAKKPKKLACEIFWDKYLQDLNLCEFVKTLHPPEIQTLVPLGWKPMQHRGKMMLLLEANSHLYMLDLETKRDVTYMRVISFKISILKKCYKVRFFCHTPTNDNIKDLNQHRRYVMLIRIKLTQFFSPCKNSVTNQKTCKTTTLSLCFKLQLQVF